MGRRKVSGLSGMAKPASKSSLSSEAIYRARLTEMRQGTAIFPLDAPGLPALPSNSAFLSHAMALGDTDSKVVKKVSKAADGKQITEQTLVYSSMLTKLIQDALRLPNFTLPVEVGPHQEKEATFVPGHMWGDYKKPGPKAADVMIINKNPWSPELTAKCCFAGEDGKLLMQLFRKLKIEATDCYVTHLVKFCPPDFKPVLRASWVKDAMHLLYQEIKIVQPKYILCLGSDTSKALLGSSASVSDMEGRVETLRYNVAYSSKDVESHWREAQVMTVVHPKSVIRDQSAERQLENGLARFAALLKGVDVGKRETVDHRIVDNLAQLLEELLEIEHDPDKEDDVIAVDAEWHGQHPINAGAYMRTIQLSHAPKKHWVSNCTRPVVTPWRVSRIQEQTIAGRYLQRLWIC